MKQRPAKILLLLVLGITTDQLSATNIPYQKLLEDQFPKCERTKENIFLTKQQHKNLEQLWGEKVYSKLALRFKIKCGDEVLRYSYVDSHIVRTLNETVLITIDEQNKIERYQISSFMEPTEYKPPTKWLKQLLNRTILKNYRLGYEVDALSGATLSAQASVKTSRKILFLHKILSQK